MAASEMTSVAQRDHVRVMRLLDRHDRYSATTLNLIPSLNVPSQAIYRAMHSDLLNRVAEGWVGERSFPGMKFYEMIEQIGITSAKRLFRYEHVDLRPISGTLANAAVFGAFTKSGDTIVTLGLQQGAHNSMATDLPCKVFGLRVECLPFDRDSLNIDVIRAIKLLRSASPAPKLVMLGGSVLLYPQPLRPIVKAAHEFGAIVVYDGSHVAGLIAGGEFQDPYEDNIDVVTMATCKTMPGPQGAMILSRPEFSDRLKHVISPTLHSGHHLHETVGKVLALLELEAFGAKYAQKVISNAQRLGDELSSRNLPVYSRRGGPTTLSHTLLVDCTRWGGRNSRRANSRIRRYSRKSRLAARRAGGASTERDSYRYARNDSVRHETGRYVGHSELYQPVIRRRGSPTDPSRSQSVSIPVSSRRLLLP